MVKQKQSDTVDFWIGLVCTVGIIIAMGCMVYMFATAP